MTTKPSNAAVAGLLLIGACSSNGPGPLAVDAGGPGPAGSCARETRLIELDVGVGILKGTLELPAACGPYTVALIHAGSGPTDRDGNSAGLPGRNDSLKLLAEALAERGIASVRYDKRGIAASAAVGPRSERDVRLSQFVEDAGRWLDRLSADPSYRHLLAIGHSEGSLIEMLAVGERPGIGFVSLAGAGRRAGVILREQLAAQLPPALLEQANRIISELEAGREVADVPAALASLFRPSVQPYLIDWFARDPVAAVRALQLPPLVVQGTTDLQVSAVDAEALAGARPDAQLAMIEGMNHVLKQVEGNLTAQLPSYSDPTLPLHPQLVDTIAAFAAHAFR